MRRESRYKDNAVKFTKLGNILKVINHTNANSTNWEISNKQAILTIPSGSHAV